MTTMTTCETLLSDALAKLSVEKGFGSCRFLRFLSLRGTYLNYLAEDCTLSPNCVKLITKGFVNENLIGCNVTDRDTNFTLAVSDFGPTCLSPTKLSELTTPPTTMPRPATTSAPNTTAVTTTTRPLGTTTAPTTEVAKSNATTVTSFAAPTGPTVKAMWSLLVCLALLFM